MNYFYLCFLLLLSFSATAQEVSLKEKVSELQLQIAKTEGAEKLKLTDSLILIIEFNEAYKYSTIIKDNIKLALSLDSIRSATKNTADLIYYQNIYLNEPKIGLETFKNYRGKEESGIDYNPKVNLYLYGADSYLLLGDFDSSLQVLETAQKYAIASKNENRVAAVYYRIGFIQSRAGDLAKASQNMQKARKLYLKIKDTLQYVNSNIALATLYDLNEFYEEAKVIRDETIEISKQTQNKPSLSILYFYQAAQYNLLDNQKERIHYLNLALDAVETSIQKNYYKPGIVLTAVMAYAQNDSITKAEDLLTKIDEYPNSKTAEFEAGIYIETLKELAFAKGNYNEALTYGKQHLAIQRAQDNYETLYNAEKFLANVYTALGDTNNSNEHLVAYYGIKDSINTVKKVQTLSYYQTIYETEKRDLKIEAQESDIALLNAKEKVRSQWYIIGVITLLGIFGIVVLLRARNYARKKQKMQASFTKDILKTQENERARIAGELHDSVGQKLLIIKNSFVGREKEAEDEISLVGETIREVREMSHNLHPFQFEKLGLMKSLKNMVVTFQKNSNVFYSEDIDIEDGNIPKEKEIYLFRMLQECLTNVEKHAEATACNLSVTENKKKVTFQLKDNGKGFSFPGNTSKLEGLGMKTLQERAQFIGAALTIDSHPNKGTIISIKVPKK